MLKRILLFCLCALLPAVSVQAGNGHSLHGVGAVNSSMGGAGAGLPDEVIGALYANPALLTHFAGYEVGVSVEAFQDAPRIDSVGSVFDANGQPGPVTSSSDSADHELGLIPAIGISYHKPDSKLAWGFGILGVAGFRTDWPGVDDSPVFQREPFGYGRVHTDLVITKFPLAGAWQVTDKLSLGAELAVFQGKFAVSPFPVAPADCTPNGGFANHECFFSPASNQVSAYSAAAQLGFLYDINPVWSLGGSWLSKQKFNKYEWSSVVANPNHNFGQPRRFSEEVDGPQSVVLGLGIKPTPQLRIALDAKWVNYGNTAGFSGRGFAVVDGGPKLRGIGWDDIWIGMLGVEYAATPNVTLRAGVNFNDSPIAKERVFQSLGTPSTYQQHYCAGLGVRLTDKASLNLGFYYVPREKITGKILSYTEPPPFEVQGTVFTESDTITSGLFALSFHF